MSEDCEFCKIVSGFEPEKIVYRDDDVICFFPRTQYSKGHTLVAPTAHYTDIFDIPNNISACVMNTVKVIGQHYRKAIGCEGINLMHASGVAAQQSVFHFHMHIMPRFTDDNLNTMPHVQKWEGDSVELWKLLKVGNCA